MRSLQLVNLAAKLALNKKSYDIKKIDLKKVTSVADYFLICSADVSVQVRAIADEIEDGLKLKGERLFKREGQEIGNWIILDYVDVVIHIMKKEIREFYNLENLWGDAKITSVVEKKLTKAKVSRKKVTKK